MRKVAPDSLWANGLWNHFTNRKKYTVKCGNCSHTYDDKVSFLTDDASSLCPACRAPNVWSHQTFLSLYSEAKAKGQI